MTTSGPARSGWRLRAPVLAATLVVSAVGCTPGAPPVEPGPPDAAAVSVELSFTQLLPDEGTPKGLLRVVNTGEQPLPVTGAGLDWSGYGPAFLREQDSTLRPGQTLDLHVLLPAAACDEGSEPVQGVVETPDTTVRVQLSDDGERFLRHLWERGCLADLLADQVDVSYADGWTLDRESEAVVGDLLLERSGGDLSVSVTSARGSVLYDVALPAHVTSRLEDETVRVPLRILPGNRCDEHAIGQATAPFTFRIGVRIGDDVSTKLLIPPPPRVQAQTTRMLRLSCARRG